MPTNGFYCKPTLITNVSTVSRVVQEEIFGPVAVAMPFRTAKEAIAMGNNTCYGLGKKPFFRMGCDQVAAVFQDISFSRMNSNGTYSRWSN